MKQLTPRIYWSSQLEYKAAPTRIYWSSQLEDKAAPNRIYWSSQLEYIGALNLKSELKTLE